MNHWNWNEGKDLLDHTSQFPCECRLILYNAPRVLCTVFERLEQLGPSIISQGKGFFTRGLSVSPLHLMFPLKKINKNLFTCCIQNLLQCRETLYMLTS